MTRLLRLLAAIGGAAALAASASTASTVGPVVPAGDACPDGELHEGVCYGVADTTRRDAEHDFGSGPAHPDPGQRLCRVDFAAQQVVAVYVHNGDNKHWPAADSDIQDALAGMQRVFDQTAIDQGADQALVPRMAGTRAGDGSCRFRVEVIKLSRSVPVDDLDRLEDELADRGLDDVNRNYVLFFEEAQPGACGLGRYAFDDRPDPDVNANNRRRRPHLATIYAECWDAETVAHEVTHNLGAVLDGSPNANGAGHCNDGTEVMCYDDGSVGSGGFRDDVCSTPLLLDCNHNDYFDVDGRSSGWLRDHWNVADSWWLMPVPAGSTDPGAPAPPYQRFRDVPLDHLFHRTIGNLAEAGITRGCNRPDYDRFCPSDPVTRAQMATFLTEALDLRPSRTNRFTDDDGNVHEANIQALAAAGITRGCNPPANDRFCPSDPVTRAQMATFLTEALDLRPSRTNRFTDDDGNVHEANIQALAAAGITRGCNPPANDRFCPGDPVTRAQMSAFLDNADLT